MKTSSRRAVIKWLVGTLLLEPIVANARLTSASSRLPDTREKCDALFSKLMPRDANCIISREAPAVFAAIYESAVPDASPDDPSRIRWLCLAVKANSESFEVQASSEVLLQKSDWHPVDVSLELNGGSVEISEDKLRGNVFQRWRWDGAQWLLSERRAADVFHDELIIEEYNAAQSKVVVATGRIDRNGFDSVMHHRHSSQVDVAKYDGGSLT